MAEIEFKASLYLAPDGPVLPSFVIEALMIAAAKKSKEGNDAKAGMYCPGNALLQYDGPRTADELWADESFRHVALVRVGTARVARTRPIFQKWSADIALSVETSIVNPARVDDWIVVAGAQIGAGDWRPKYGRFQAVRL